MWTLITAVVFGGHIVGVSEFSKRFSAERLVWLQLPGTAIATFVAAMLIEPLRWDWSPGLVGALLYGRCVHNVRCRRRGRR